MRSPNDPTARPTSPEDPGRNRIIRRFGGRHLIFRTRLGGWPLLPRPCLLVSAFRGPVWIFYGVGQIWLTHRRAGEIDGWLVRAPRVASGKLLALLDRLNDPLARFIAYCRRHGIEGTIVIERQAMEFHWTFGLELSNEKLKAENSPELEPEFKKLVEQFEAVAVMDAG